MTRLAFATLCACLSLASSAFAAEARVAKLDRCARGGRPQLICTHLTGRAGPSVQLDLCKEGRLIATVSQPGPDDRVAPSDAQVVTEAPGVSGNQHSWNNNKSGFNLSVDYGTKTPKGGHQGSFRYGRGPSTTLSCNRMR